MPQTQLTGRLRGGEERVHEPMPIGTSEISLKIEIWYFDSLDNLPIQILVLR